MPIGASPDGAPMVSEGLSAVLRAGSQETEVGHRVGIVPNRTSDPLVCSWMNSRQLSESWLWQKRLSFQLVLRDNDTTHSGSTV